MMRLLCEAVRDALFGLSLVCGAAAMFAISDGGDPARATFLMLVAIFALLLMLTLWLFAMVEHLRRGAANLQALVAGHREQAEVIGQVFADSCRETDR